MTAQAHITGTDPQVRATYDRLLAAARTLGRVTEDPKKTSIHLVRHTAFAGIATRHSALVLTLKSAKDVRIEGAFDGQNDWSAGSRHPLLSSS